MTFYLIGIDGGGTSCRAAVAALGGRILGRGKAGAANILTDPETALQNITDAARDAFGDAGLDPAGIGASRAIVGVAGHNVGDAVHYVKRRLPFAQADIESDGLIALQGALGDGTGPSRYSGRARSISRAGAMRSAMSAAGGSRSEITAAAHASVTRCCRRACLPMTAYIKARA